jgi:EmrB/QacA subfamily drug resistance transporter
MNKRTKLLLTLGIMVGLLVSSLDTTIVDTAFPRIVADLHGEAIFTWVLTIYMLASTAIVPMVGKLSDTHGRKAFYLGGVLIFVIGSVLCGLAGSMGQLILFRGIQGIGGGMLLPVAYTIVGDIYPGEQRATAQAFVGAVWGIAASVGPKLGGWITLHYTWRWVFFINLPIGLISVAIMLFAYKESRGSESRPVDWLGSATITAGIVSFMVALSQGGEAWAWSSWQSLLLFGASVALLLLFARVEAVAAEPVMDPALFRNRLFTATNVAGFASAAAMYCALLFIPWFIQGVGGVDPNQAGNVAMPMMIALGMCTVLAGRLAVRLPYRYIFSAGFVFLAAGFYLMTGWGVGTTPLRATLCSVVVGAGLGLIIPMVTPTLQNAFPANQRGVVTSASQFFRQIGSTMGLTIFGLIFNHAMAGALQAQLSTAAAGDSPAAQYFRQAASDPQALVRVLLNPSLQDAIPAAARTQVVALVKGMMAGSLQMVFWAAVAASVVGLLGSQLLGSASLRQQTADCGRMETADGLK